MTKKCLATLIVVLIFPKFLRAEPCPIDLNSFFPTVKVPEIGVEVNPHTHFCFDEKSVSDPETLKKFKMLKEKNVLSKSNCVKDEKFDSHTNQQITDLILDTIRSTASIYTLGNEIKIPHGNELLILTNSNDEDFVKKAMIDKSNELDHKDTIEIAAAAVSSSLIGIVAERNISAFRNKDGSLQHDKVLHANAGALINIGGVAGSYYIVETLGLGNKFKLSKTQKKWTILLTGTVLGMLAGYGKERFYDYYHQDKHTYDPHLKGDMGATWLGGGSLNALTGAISFQFD